MNNVFLRLLTSICLIPVIIFLIYLNNFFSFIVLISIFSIAIYEMRFLFFNLKSPQNKKKYINIICCICWGLLWVLAFKVLRGDTIQDFNYLMWIIFIVIAIPLTLLIAVITFPYKVYLLLTRISAPKSKIKVKVTGPEGEYKDDLLFIHGWPDSGDLWKY